MSQDDRKSASDAFNEVPSWYEAPTLTAEQLDPNFVPPQHKRLGETAGMGAAAIPRDKGMDPGRMMTLIWCGIFFFLGGGILIAMLVGIIGNGLLSSGDDLAVGDCVGPVVSDNAVGVSVGSGGCDDDLPLVYVGSFEAGGVEQMPVEDDPFWESAAARCNDMLTSTGIPLPLPAAASNAEWEQGNHTVICTSISMEGFTEGFAEAFAELDADIVNSQ